MSRAFFLLVLASIFGVSSCWEGTTRSLCATILSGHGEVKYFEQTSTNSRPVDSKTKLCAGSILKTASDGEVDLMLIPGALARIPADSELKIVELKLTKDGNETGESIRERRARVELRRGGMIVLFEGFAQFNIETANVAINVLPSCLFRLDVDQSRTRLTCVHGKVFATENSGQRVAVEAGFFCEWPAERSAISVSEDRQAQRDVTTTLQIGRELSDLGAAARDRLPGVP
jgi:hypothetical protein